MNYKCIVCKKTYFSKEDSLVCEINCIKDKLHRRNMIISDLRRHLEEAERHIRDLKEELKKYMQFSISKAEVSPADYINR